MAIRLRTAFLAVIVLVLVGAAGGAWAFSRYGENLPDQTIDLVPGMASDDAGERDRSAAPILVPKTTTPPTKDPTPTPMPDATATPRVTQEPTATPNATVMLDATALPRATAEPSVTLDAAATPRATVELTTTPDPEMTAETAASIENDEFVEPAATSPTQVAEHGYVAVTDLGECGRFMFEPSEIPNGATREVDETSGCPYVKSTNRGDGQTDSYVLDMYEGQRLHIETSGLDDSTVKVAGPSGAVRLDRKPDNGEIDVLVEAQDGAGAYRLVVEDRGAGGEYGISFQDVSHGLVTPVESVAIDDDCEVLWLTPNAIPNDAEISVDRETKCPHIAGVTGGRGDRDVYVLGLVERQAISISTQGLNKSFVTVTGPNGKVVLDREYQPGNIDLVVEANNGSGGYVFMIEEEGRDDEYSITFVDVTDGATLGG